MVVCLKATLASPKDQKIKVAIIGGGAAGAGTALSLRDFFGDLCYLPQDQLEIHLFESELQIGGRVFDQEINGLRMELGGALFHNQNRLMMDMVRRFNLSTYNPMEGAILSDGSRTRPLRWDSEPFSIWNSTSHSAAIELSRFELFSRLQLLWFYGWSPIKVRSLANDAMEKFLKLYDLLDPKTNLSSVRGFASLSQLLDQVGLLEYTTQTLREFLIDSHGVDPFFVDTFVAGLSRVNYNQDAGSVHALAGLVALIGSSAEDVLSIGEGNRVALERAIQESHATLHLSEKVVQLDFLQPKKKWRLTVESSRQTVPQDLQIDFDFVVHANPFYRSAIKINSHDKGVSDRISNSWRKMHLTHVTFVAGIFRHFSDGKAQQLLTVEGDMGLFTSILPRAVLSIVPKTKRDRAFRLYKIFSSSIISDRHLDDLFLHRTTVIRKSWLAYPELEPVRSSDTTLPDFDMGNGLFYPNAFESAVSCIETSLLAGRNVALLILDQIAQRYPLSASLKEREQQQHHHHTDL